MLFLYTLFLAIAAFTYSEILPSPGMLLNNIYDALERKVPAWLFKPLIGCCKCVAGQWALWLYIIFFHQQYNLVMHVWVVLQSVFNVSVVRALYYKIIN